MRTATILAIYLAGLLAANGARADDMDVGSVPKTYPVMDFGIARGGDKIVDQHFFFGGRSSIHAGDAYSGDVGLIHDFQGSDWSFKGTFGYASATTSVFNGDTFKRFPLDLLAVYNTGRQHFGFGATYHFNPRLDTNSNGPDQRFEGAPGLVLQYQYWMFGARYTYIRYKYADAPGNPTVDGSSLGLFVSITFGK